MSTRLDAALRKHPEHEEGIRQLAARDPSGNLKYLDWGAKILASGQALATEIADVLDLFHQFAGRRLEQTGRAARRGHSVRRIGGGQRVHPDIHVYQPGDLAKLRDLLLKMKRAADRKRKKREQLYRIEGAVEAEVVYDSDDLVVRHIKNKQASVHYGHDTKWCISMLREGYFEEYESHNATFFFFERKTPKGDEYDKVALMIPRSEASDPYGRDEGARAFTSLDQAVDMMMLAKAHGPRVFDIFRQVYERSEQYPGSAMFQVYSGVANEEQIRTVVATMAHEKRLGSYEVNTLIEAICCNDAVSWPILQEIERGAYKLSIAAGKRKASGFRHRRTRLRRAEQQAKELVRVVAAALVIHPQTPPEERERLTRELRRRHVNVGAIHRVKEHGRITISYVAPTFGGFGRMRRRRYRRRRRFTTVMQIRARAEMLDRAAKRMRKKARTLARKLAEKKRRKDKREKLLAKNKALRAKRK